MLVISRLICIVNSYNIASDWIGALTSVATAISTQHHNIWIGVQSVEVALEHSQTVAVTNNSSKYGCHCSLFLDYMHKSACSCQRKAINLDLFSCVTVLFHFFGPCGIWFCDVQVDIKRNGLAFKLGLCGALKDDGDNICGGYRWLTGGEGNKE